MEFFSTPVIYQLFNFFEQIFRQFFRDEFLGSFFGWIFSYNFSGSFFSLLWWFLSGVLWLIKNGIIIMIIDLNPFQGRFFQVTIYLWLFTLIRWCHCRRAADLVLDPYQSFTAPNQTVTGTHDESCKSYDPLSWIICITIPVHCSNVWSTFY